MAEKTEVDVPERATPFEAAEARESGLPSLFGATFAERAKARDAAGKKQVKAADVEDKAVKKATTKAKKKA